MERVKFTGKAALALVFLALSQLVQAAATSKATDAAPRADEIEWIDFSDYSHAGVTSVGGQGFSIDLLDGRTLRFALRHHVDDPDISTHGADASPISFAGASFGRTGYLDIQGRPIIYGRRQGRLEISNIRVSDADGNLYAFEWVAADAESTGHAATRQEFIEFESNGGGWVQTASLDRVDGTPNSGSLEISASPNMARLYTEIVTMPEGGAYVVATESPSVVTFTYGSNNVDPSLPAARQAAAFGVIPGSTVIGRLEPANVPVNHPLAMISGMLALGLVARRKFLAL